MSRGGWLRPPPPRTGQEERLVHHVLLAESDVAEVLLALADGADITTLLEHLHNQLFCGVLWQASHKHRLAAGRALPGGRRRQICGEGEEEEREACPF